MQKGRSAPRADLSVVESLLHDSPFPTTRWALSRLVDSSHAAGASLGAYANAA
jgi:hypothetical protein